MPLTKIELSQAIAGLLIVAYFAATTAGAVPHDENLVNGLVTIAAITLFGPAARDRLGGSSE